MPKIRLRLEGGEGHLTASGSIFRAPSASSRPWLAKHAQFYGVSGSAAAISKIVSAMHWASGSRRNQAREKSVGLSM